MAARAGKKDVVLMLLSNDADPYLEGPNGDPREVAFVSNQSEIVDLFDGLFLFLLCWLWPRRPFDRTAD